MQQTQPESNSRDDDDRSSGGSSGSAHDPSLHSFLMIDEVFSRLSRVLRMQASSRCGYCATRTADPPLHSNEAVDRLFSLGAMAARDSKSFVPCDDCRSFFDRSAASSSPAPAIESKP